VTSWQELVEPIKSDRERGASQLYRALLATLSAYLNSQPPESIDFRSLAEAVSQVRPEMAPFHYLAGRINQLVEPAPERQSLMDLFDELEREVDSAVPLIAEIMKPLVAQCDALMLHSYSGTLKSAVLAAVAKNVNLFLSEAKPDREGLKLARELSQQGYSVTTFPDADASQWLPKAVAVVVGADWISEEYFVNKVGTLELARGAAKRSMPFYVVADKTKLVSARFREQSSDTERASLFEKTPSELVTTFLLPDGAYPPSEIPKLL